MTDLRRSPLHDRHVALGAKLADFGGWEMPIEYTASGGGVLKEHAAVRKAVGVFDVSHLGKASVRGAGAAAFVNATLSNDLGRIGPGQAQYTLCCDITAERVLSLSGPDPAEVIAEGRVDEGRGSRAPHAGLTEVRYVEDAHRLPHRGMLLQHPATGRGVLDGHLPAA